MPSRQARALPQVWIVTGRQELADSASCVRVLISLARNPASLDWVRIRYASESAQSLRTQRQHSCSESTEPFNGSERSRP